MELLEIFGETALRSRYDAWTYVDLRDKIKILKTFSGGYKAICSAAGVEDLIPSFDVADTLRVQKFIGSQLPRNEAAKIWSLLD